MAGEIKYYLCVTNILHNALKNQAKVGLHWAVIH